MRISDWSSDVCSSDLPAPALAVGADEESPLLAIESPRHQLHARGRQADAQFLVYAGSTARAAWIGMDGGYKVLPPDLFDRGTLGAFLGEVILFASFSYIVFHFVLFSVFPLFFFFNFFLF